MKTWLLWNTKSPLYPDLDLCANLYVSNMLEITVPMECS